MEKVKILKAVDIINDSVSEYEGERPFLSTGDLNLSTITNLELHTFSEKPSRANQNVSSGDLILARMQGTVKVKLINNEDENIIVSTGFLVLRPKSDTDKNYLFHLLKSSNFQNDKDKLCTGATQKAINNSNFEKLEIPLPNLATQQRIAAILDQADAIIQNNRAIVQKYDALTQSLFLDMFGDPVKNEKGWGVKSLNDLCNKITDGTHDTPKRLTEGIKFITGKHIRPFEIDYDNSDYVTEEIHKEIFKRCNPEYGDVLYTNIGVNFATAAMNTVEYEFSMKNVALLKYNRELLNGRYLVHILNNEFFKDKLKKTFGVGGAQQFLSLSNIKSILVLVPPITLQNQFAERVAMIEAQKQQAQLELAKSEELFQSLLQRAFKGELN